MTRAAFPAALFALLLGAAACGLKPVYSGGIEGPSASMLAGIEIPVIPDHAGYLVRQALLDKTGGGAANAGRYRLDIRLDDSISGLGVRGDNSVSRERRLLRARWQLVDIASGKTVIDEAARADAGIDVVSSEYAVIAAEKAALERLSDDIAAQIAARIALFAQAQNPADQ